MHGNLNAAPQPFPPTSLDTGLGFCSVLRPFFLLVEDETEYVETELGNIKTQLFEFLLRFVTQDMAPHRPERSHRLPYRDIVDWSMGVHIPGVRYLTLGGAVDTVDFRMSKCLQRRYTQLLRQRVDPCMLQQLVATIINFSHDGFFCR